MNYCPCCSHQLLRHIRNHEIYWFCRSCWQEMPVVSGHKCILTCEASEAAAVRTLPVRRETKQGARANKQRTMVFS
ncbi:MULTISPECIES: hypothetical protein [Nostocales]|uniref:Uncharacterized protein n=2 Tax=Nostocales TaxID=1161 RepID=A0A8S9STF5_9CYAN|nr:hypothetical protein [Tolypothrix bouteillei]KAF3884041.1 hypothetical protein DA73_0400014100 [Tolypothrix bouteillei VB521301]